MMSGRRGTVFVSAIGAVDLNERSAGAATTVAGAPTVFVDAPDTSCNRGTYAIALRADSRSRRRAAPARARAAHRRGARLGGGSALLLSRPARASPLVDGDEARTTSAWMSVCICTTPFTGGGCASVRSRPVTDEG